MADFDGLTRLAGATRSRRAALGLLGRGALGTLLGAAAGGIPGTRGPTVAAQTTCIVEYPPSNLSNCPNKRPHPGNVRTSNGCGAAGSDFRPPQGFGRVNFQPACNAHDVCYETCGNGKLSCDTDFYTGLADACRAEYGSSGLMLTGCLTAAEAFTAAVVVGGYSAHQEAQKKDCECCHPVPPPPPPPPAYCRCTNTCYSSATECTSKCKASLGCFTDICRPAFPGECL